jgi:integrase
MPRIDIHTHFQCLDFVKHLLGRSAFLRSVLDFTPKPPCQLCDDYFTNSRFGREADNYGEIASQAGAPTTEKRTVATPHCPKNAEVRTREYLTDAEVARLAEAAKANRYGHRDATMILVAYRHGLRASELTDLQWNQIDFDAGTMAVRRAKKGSPNTHPIRGDELRALRRLAREQDPKSPFVFTSERGATFTTAGFARMVERAGEAADLGFKAHPHMLRHAFGFALANKGHDTRALQAYLGHKNIQHTVRYTELAPDRFKDFWR